MIGLTGTAAQIAEAERVYRVYAAKAPAPEGKTDYMMDHTGYIYLMDRDGHYIAHFSQRSDRPGDRGPAAARIESEMNCR